jgi:hypothetical protein
MNAVILAYGPTILAGFGLGVGFIVREVRKSQESLDHRVDELSDRILQISERQHVLRRDVDEVRRLRRVR